MLASLTRSGYDYQRDSNPWPVPALTPQSKSMSESGKSPAIRSSRKWYKAIGPGLITACVVIGPGSILSSSKVGAGQGYGYTGARGGGDEGVGDVEAVTDVGEF